MESNAPDVLSLSIPACWGHDDSENLYFRANAPAECRTGPLFSRAVFFSGQGIYISIIIETDIDRMSNECYI